MKLLEMLKKAICRDAAGLHAKRQCAKIVMLMLCILLSLPCAGAFAQEELVIVHATDMHYLSPSLTDYGEAFMQIIEAADGKVTHYTPQIMQAFVEDMLAIKPDAVILSGDLTLNGAPQSHEELTQLLAPLKEAGIQVLALSGNHDTGGEAYRFGPDGVEAIVCMEDEQFDDAYAAFGYDEAISRDAASMSYAAQLSPDVWCLLVDVNANGTSGTVNEETFVWIEDQLIKARDAGITVVTVSHQPVLSHNRLFSFGYVINNNTRLMDLYAKYDVQLNLSGHLHMQHAAQSGSLVEIAASSLAVAPNQYGVLRVQEGRLVDYAMQPVDVSGWAARTGQTDANLLDFAGYSRTFFDKTTRSQLEAMFAETQIGAEEQQKMMDLAVRVNAEYFAGTRSAAAENADFALWEKYLPDSFFTYYLRSIVQEEAGAMNHVAFDAVQ